MENSASLFNGEAGVGLCALLRLRLSTGGGRGGVLLGGFGLSVGFDEGAAKDAGANEDGLSYYAVRLGAVLATEVPEKRDWLRGSVAGSGPGREYTIV